MTTSRSTSFDRAEAGPPAASPLHLRPMIERILGIILPVFGLIAVGYLYARRARPDVTWLNRISVELLAPALIFSSLASKDFDLGANKLLLAGSIGVVLISGLVAWPLARLLRIDLRTFLPPMMFNNCGNMGLPLAMLGFGPLGLSQMVAMFSVSNLLHFTLGVRIVDRHASFWPIARSPMVIATIVGFVFALSHPPAPDWLMVAIRMMGEAMIPLVLLSLGARIAEVRLRHGMLGIVGGLVCPLAGMAAALALGRLLDLDAMQRGLLLLFGALPPAVFNFVIAEQYNQEPAKVASIVLIGNLLSLAFVPLALSVALR